MNIAIPSFENTRVLVVGDIMLDRYWYGATNRISPEAPVPVVHIQKEEDRPGGAGNVALNVVALGCQATLLGICGDDDSATVLENKLRAAQVDTQLYKLQGVPTTTKLRVLSSLFHQQLIRLDFEVPLLNFDDAALCAEFQAQLPHTNAVLLSDYAKGTLRCAPALIAMARKANIPILVDPKGTDFSIYRGATLLTPNLKEFEAVVGHCNDEQELVSKGLQLIEKLNLEALLVTRGEQGMTLIQPNLPEKHLPALEREVYDVTGAGDTVIAVLASCLAAGENLSTATVLANIAASIAVAKMGAATVSLPELRRAAWQEQSAGRGIFTEDQLLIAVQDAKAHGERIVMTNGCFDILHAGHVAYLEQAKALGDRLLVAVNNDASVSQLKGADRPINALARRMTVLAGLSAVDWVVGFADNTPERLLEILNPDILVKGGDYSIDQVVGAEIVLKKGGTVKVLGLEEGLSTSIIIDKLSQVKS
jgi:D-beta-D-heptose 7-phosphate kinase / D-beta-D-heptose 1-phosphate adenosyltransferase